MAYVATRGGEAAIQQAERLFHAETGDLTPERVSEIERALPWLIDLYWGTVMRQCFALVRLPS